MYMYYDYVLCTCVVFICLGTGVGTGVPCLRHLISYATHISF